MNQQPFARFQQRALLQREPGGVVDDGHSGRLREAHPLWNAERTEAVRETEFGVAAAVGEREYAITLVRRR